VACVGLLYISEFHKLLLKKVDKNPGVSQPNESHFENFDFLK
jgi:hypothetical protein